MNEVWKVIKEYPNYMISNLGNIKSLNYKRTGKEQLLKQNINGRGYCYVNISINNKYKNILIHREVAKAFIPTNDEKLDINHKDGNKQNNIVDNLEWCDKKYNNTYGSRIDRASKSCKKKVQCIETGIIYDSAKDIEKLLKINHSHISDCCKGKRNKTGGYSWRFVNE